MPAINPLPSILNAFAEARSRDQARYRCSECGAVRFDYSGERPASLPCWATDRHIFCTGRAAREDA